MGELYTKLFMQSFLASAEPEAAIMLLFLFLARILPIISLSPFFGSRTLPHPVKVTFAISLFIVFLPKLLTITTKPMGFNLESVGYLMKEMLIGFIMGFIVSMPFQIVQSAGIIIDHQRGGASLMVNDPTIQNQSSPLGTMFNFVLIYLFWIIDGPFLLLDGIMRSYDIIPPDKFINPKLFEQGTPFWNGQAKILYEMMKITTQIAAPALIMVLMTDVFLGIANRLAPQVQITFLGMPLKSLLALFIIYLGWNLMTQEMANQSFAWLKVMDKAVLMFR